MRVIDESARTLKPGGTLIVECPNPETLRVGGGLFWIDPTHRSPVHAHAVQFAAKAVGLEVVETRFMRPFPADQALARPGQPDAVFDLATRLDTWLSGPRDFVVVARKPGAKVARARRRTPRGPGPAGRAGGTTSRGPARRQRT
jgi:O-antigen chain-terminating methyltransferase